MLGNVPSWQLKRFVSTSSLENVGVAAAPVFGVIELFGTGLVSSMILEHHELSSGLSSESSETNNGSP